MMREGVEEGYEAICADRSFEEVLECLASYRAHIGEVLNHPGAELMEVWRWKGLGGVMGKSQSERPMETSFVNQYWDYCVEGHQGLLQNSKVIKEEVGSDYFIVLRAKGTIGNEKISLTRMALLCREGKVPK